MPAIEVSGLSKHYRIYPGPRSLLKEILTGKGSHTLVKALNEVSFQVAEGEAFGIVGENGAGKSTLLKLLTATAVPSAGELTVCGKVSSLLELGAGFHHEFSGLENIYFSGALMGYSRNEIAECEKEIIAFSELQDSIANPVKTYSTGMILRLGFAIATGFEPSVLIIDEALAVGDQRFQKRCTDRILDFKSRGVTILFCSHNLHLVKTLCDRALWLRRGHEEALGAAGWVVDRFADHLRGVDTAAVAPTAHPPPLSSAILSVQTRGPRGRGQSEFYPGDTLELEIEASFEIDFSGEPAIGVAIVRNDDTLVYSTNTALANHPLGTTESGRRTCRFVLPDLSLLSGAYHCNVFTTDEASLLAYHSAEQVVSFTVSSRGGEQGLVKLQHRWE